MSAGNGIQTDRGSFSVNNTANGSIVTQGEDITSNGSLQMINTGMIESQLSYAVYSYRTAQDIESNITNSGILKGRNGGISITSSTGSQARNRILNAARGRILSTESNGSGVMVLHGVTTLVNEAGAFIQAARHGGEAVDLFTELVVDNAGEFLAGSGYKEE